MGNKGRFGVVAKGRAGTGEGRVRLQAQSAVGDRLLEEKQRKGRSGLRRKCDPGKRGEGRDNGKETQVIKGTAGSGREGEGRGKRAKREVGRRWWLERGNQITNRTNFHGHGGRASDKQCQGEIKNKKSNNNYPPEFNAVICFTYRMTENSCIS